MDGGVEPNTDPVVDADLEVPPKTDPVETVGLDDPPKTDPVDIMDVPPNTEAVAG